MRRVGAVLGPLLLVTVAGTGQEAGSRAWQQRLEVNVPVPLPVVELESTNPFSTAVDAAPRLLAFVTPRKLTVSGDAVVAAYIDDKGECLGVVPLDLPFPGLTSAVVEGFTGNRFEPARAGSTATPSWAVVQVGIEARVKESAVLDQDLRLPDPSIPPERTIPSRVSPSGHLLRLPATPAGELTSLAVPRRLRLKAPGRDADVRMTALVHITAEGLCDRYVPLEMDSGFEPWLSAFLSSWRLEPAIRDGAPIDAWLVYSANVQLKLSGLQSTTVRALSDRTYDPREDEPEAG